VTPRLTRLRRPLASLFAAAAAGLALLALRPGPPPSVRVLAAARDLPAGKTLAPSDLHRVDLPPSAVPSGTFRTSAAGRVLAGPMRKGEPLTDARVMGESLLKGYAPGTVATPVRIADPAAVRLLHPGDHIDVLAHPSPDLPPPEGPPTKTTKALAPPAPLNAARATTTAPPPEPPRLNAHKLTASRWAQVVVAAVPVIAVPPAADDGDQEGALVVLATDKTQALALAAATPPLSLTITRL
jgi:Flp pilus assembly protein CpaB